MGFAMGSTHPACLTGKSPARFFDPSVNPNLKKYSVFQKCKSPAFHAPSIRRGRDLAKKAFGEIVKSCLNVIASAAKQSIAQPHRGSKKEWIASLHSQ